MAIIEKPGTSADLPRQIGLFFCHLIAFPVCTGYGSAIENTGDKQDGTWGMDVRKNWTGSLSAGFFGKGEMPRIRRHIRRFAKGILIKSLLLRIRDSWILSFLICDEHSIFRRGGHAWEKREKQPGSQARKKGGRETGRRQWGCLLRCFGM